MLLHKSLNFDFAKACISCWILLVCVSNVAASNPEEAPSPQPETGIIDFQFTKRSPKSSLRTMATRFKSDIPQDYELREETIQAYVPESYDPANPPGIFIWVSPIPNTAFRDLSIELFKDKNLITATAINAGNKREPFHRIGLALDSVFNLKERYVIDSSRIYISGFSGGGRISSMAAMHYPEVFTGWFSVCGVNFYERVQDPDKPKGMKWSAFTPPSRKRLNQVKNNTRAVLLTGSKDFNLSQTKVFYERFKKDGFKHVLYLEVPEMEHAVPIEGDWFDRALNYLDGK